MHVDVVAGGDLGGAVREAAALLASEEERRAHALGTEHLEPRNRTARVRAVVQAQRDGAALDGAVADTEGAKRCREYAHRRGPGARGRQRRRRGTHGRAIT